MISLEINLEEFALGEVLQFLCRVKKSGVLRLKGETRGEIYIKEGLVVHAIDGSEQGPDALFNLSFMRLDKGSFESGISPPAQTISLEIGKLSEDIERRRIEFQEIKRAMPPMDTVVVKSTKELPSAVALRRIDWQILALIDGKKTLSEVVAQSKLGAYEATKTIVWLKGQGLIYDPKETERVMSGLISYLEHLFAHFSKNGLTWFKDWAALSAENKKVADALDIDEENLRLKPCGELKPAEIDAFMSNFNEFIKGEGPKVYGKLLFKKKYQEFITKLNKE